MRTGIEKAERNVLPTLNNLLENREMALEDGRFLTSPARFDSLLKVLVAICNTFHEVTTLTFPIFFFIFFPQTHTAAELRRAGLIRVHPDFRVIALGHPVPMFQGMPLDPPLRSRFQARNVGFAKIDAHIDCLIRAYPYVRWFTDPKRTCLLVHPVSVCFYSCFILDTCSFSYSCPAAMSMSSSSAASRALPKHCAFSKSRRRMRPRRPLSRPRPPPSFRTFRSTWPCPSCAASSRCCRPASGTPANVR